MNQPIETSRDLKRKYRSSATQVSALLALDDADTVAGLRLRASDLAATGHRRILLAVPSCTDSRPAEAVRELLTIERKKSHIRRVDVCIAGEVDESSLKALREAGASTLVFPALSESVKLASSLGLDDLGLGMKFGADFEAQLATFLEAASRLEPRELVIKRDDSVNDESFVRIAAEIRAAQPLTGLTVDADELDALLDFATTVQTTSSEESLDSLVNRLLKAGRLPGFCAACSEECRCGSERREMCASGQLHSFCYLNSLLTLKEFLTDFGSQDSRIIGTDRVLNELYSIGNDDVRKIMIGALKELRNGARGQRF